MSSNLVIRNMVKAANITVIRLALVIIIKSLVEE